MSVFVNFITVSLNLNIVKDALCIVKLINGLVFCRSNLKLFFALSFEAVITMSGIFPSIFYCHNSMQKTQSFGVVEFLFLIHYPLENHFTEGYIFSVFYSGRAFSRNLAGFKWQTIWSNPWLGIILLTKIIVSQTTEP